MTRPPLTDEDGEVREITAEDMKLFRPIAETDMGMVVAMQRLKNSGGRPKALHPRQPIAFRFDAELIARIKATGRGYNARVEKLLLDAVAKGRL